MTIRYNEPNTEGESESFIRPFDFTVQERDELGRSKILQKMEKIYTLWYQRDITSILRLPYWLFLKGGTGVS